MIIAPKAKCIERVRSSPERAHTADILVGVIDRRLNSYEPAGRPRPWPGQQLAGREGHSQAEGGGVKSPGLLGQRPPWLGILFSLRNWRKLFLKKIESFDRLR
jgi:hypothetical protein